MVINSAMNQGLAGMQQSQKRMQQAAEDIVRAGMPTERNVPNSGSLDRVAVTNNGTAAEDLNADQSVEALNQGERAASGDLVGPLIEQKKQQLMFDASANIVKAANRALGSLIDDIS
jgi:hypothetical protein